MGTSGELSPKIRFRKIGKFSGPVIHGDVAIFDKDKAPDWLVASHVGRAFWLTSMVESGGLGGTVMMADGTGVTASLDQVIAVYPRNLKEQGPLFKMLRRVDYTTPVSYYLDFGSEGWELGDDGVLRHRITGKAVDPKDIRNTFTPNDGVVAKSKHSQDWAQSCRWATHFWQLFRMHTTHDVQIKYGKEKIVKFAKRWRIGDSRTETIENVIYDGEICNPEPFGSDDRLDLAMAVFWNYQVNAPVMAVKKLKAALKKKGVSDPGFPDELIRQLRTSGYGRWGTARYDRTRKHGRKLWPTILFNGTKNHPALMPPRKK